MNICSGYITVALLGHRVCYSHFSGYCQIFFQSGCIYLHFLQYCMSIPVAPHVCHSWYCPCEFFFFLKATLLYACLSSLLKLVLEKSRSKTLSKQTALYYVRLSFGRYRTDKVQRHIQTPIIINPGNKGITSVFSINHWKFSEKTFILPFTILPMLGYELISF